MGQPQLKTDPRWTYLTASAEYLMQTGLHCPDASYVSLTLPSPETALGITDAPSGSCTLVTTIHRVVFTTESHDQGFSDHHDQIGTYQGSYSFFEAQVIDPSTGCDRVPRRRIQYNVHGGSDFRTHVNIWDRRDESLAGVGPGAAVWSQREEGKGMQLSAWLEGIRGGDVVRLVPKAFFQGWTNVVRHARIEIWAEFLLLPLLVDRPLLFEGVGFGDCPFYRRLQTSQKEIRLVVIEPVGHDGDVEAAVRLSLQHTSLADPDHLSYDALSYCWGEANDTEAICFADCESSAEDVKIHVRRNLHSALKRLRSVDKPIILWVDLICINQTDLQERGQQVALMGEIFASAQSVRVWLGEADTEIRKDFTIIRSIAQQYGAVPCPADLRLNHDSPTEQAPRRDVSTQPRSGFSHPRETHQVIAHDTFYHIDADSVFQRPWFQRVWVMQEVWNSPNEYGIQKTMSEKQRRVMVHCGVEELPWEVLAQANHCLRGNLEFLNNYTMPPLLTNLFDVTRDRESSSLTCVPGPRRDILSVVLGGFDLQASDPRDKIFALLIFGKETHQIASLPALVKPNYTKTAARVYADFTRWWILHHDSLRILSAVHALEGRQWLDASRSWCEVLSSDRSNHSNSSQKRGPSWALWSAGHSGWANRTLALHHTSTYRACGDRASPDSELLSVPTATETSGKQDALSLKLRLRGIRLSSIAIDPVHYPYFQQPPPPDGLRDAYWRIYDRPASSVAWIDERIGEEKESRHQDQDYGARRQHYLAHWETLPPGDPYAAHTSMPAGTPTWFPCHGRCMFTTEDGALGLCPLAAMKGDVVVILFGGKVPYLLRPSQVCGEYSFVGECYVEGVMYGEALDRARGRIVEEIFHLV